MGGTKLKRFLPKNQYIQRELLNYENWVNLEVSKVPKYQQKSKAISSAEPNYFVHFAMRHPV